MLFIMQNIIWLCLIIISRMSLRVNPHSIVCLNVKKILARGRHHIWSLSDTSKIRTHNHLVVRRRTLNHLAKLVYEISGCGFEYPCYHLNFRHGVNFKLLLRATSSWTFRQTIECGFTLKLVRDTIITYSTDKYPQHSSII